MTTMDKIGMTMIGRDGRTHAVADGRALCGARLAPERDGDGSPRQGCVPCGDGIEPRALAELRLPGGAA